MKTMKKIVAILAAALLLCSILPMSIFAADTTVVFALGADGNAAHKDGSTAKTTYSETVDGYTLDITGGTKMYPASIDAKGNGCIKLGTSSAVGGFSFTVPADVTSVIIAVGKYKTNTTKLNVNGTAYTLSKASNNGEYDDITVDTTSNKTVTLTTVSGGVRAMVNTITYVIAAGNAGCDHTVLGCGETCSNCGEYTKEHKYANNCVAECENGCGTANPDYADHVYGGGTYDEYCDVCNAKRDVSFPEADTELTIAEAIALGAAMEHNVYTPGKYYVTGEITEIYNTQYGNLYLTDGENTFTVYGLYDGNGNRYDAMATKPEAGMTIKVYGMIGSYNGTAQMKNGDLISMEGGCAHEYEFDCSTTCSICGEGIRDVACVNNGVACQDGLCIYCGGDVAAVDHAFDSEYDPDCNYGCGYTREVEEAPIEATITFDDASKRVSSTTTEQVWQENGIVVNYAKGSYNNNLAEYANPIRFYAGTTVTIYYSGITSIEIVANNASYATVLGNSIAGSVVDGTVVTYILPEVADSFTFTPSAQARVNSITVYGSSSGSEDCDHSWNAATCTTPATCALCGATDGAALGHTYVEDIIDATCTATGTATYECSVCFDSYDETIPVKPHTYVDGICSGCGAELPLEATITFDADKTQRTEFSNEIQKWEHDGLTLINNKAASTTNIGDYAGRFYKSSEIIISFPGMTSLVIDATGVDADKLWDATLEAAGLSFTVESKIYTITFAEPTDSITLTAANQVRAVSISASAVKVCAHEYFDACDPICLLCGEERETSHNIVHVAALEPTCSALGNIEFWYCDACGAAWTNEACTQVTNMMSVKLPMAEHTYDDEYDADCNACGNIREVPEKPVNVIYGDADGDGEITALDVVVLQQYFAGYEVTLNEAAADADGDGEVTALDVVILQQYFAGYEVTLGPAKVFNDGKLSKW